MSLIHLSIALITLNTSLAIVAIQSSQKDCIKSTAPFAAINSSSTDLFVIEHDDSSCFDELLKETWTNQISVTIEKLKIDRPGRLKIGRGHSTFLFANSSAIQEFTSKRQVSSYSTSSVLLVAMEDCGNFEVLIAWWLKFETLKTVGFCAASNLRFFYEPFEGKLREVDSEGLPWTRGHQNSGGYPLKVAMFERVPTAVRSSNISKSLSESGTYEGLLNRLPFAGTDGFMLAELCRRLNLTPLLVAPGDGVAYGAVFENGSGFGALGAIAAGTAEISGNGIYVKDYRSDDLEFLAPYTSVSICFVAPKAAAIPQWKLVFSCFALRCWLSLIALAVLLSVLWSLFERSFGPFYLIQILVSGSRRRLPSRDSRRLLVLACLYFNMIIGSVFQGNLVKSFTKAAYYKDLDTLEDIDESGLRISTCISDIFGRSLGGARKNLEARRVKTLEMKSIQRAAYRRDCCAVERKKDAQFLIESVYVAPDGTPLLHITEACDMSYPVAHVVKKGFPLAEVFDGIIVRFVEAGFVDKWNSDVTDSITMRNRIRKGAEVGRIKVVGIREVKGAFYILVAGLGAASVALLVEVAAKVVLVLG